MKQRRARSLLFALASIVSFGCALAIACFVLMQQMRATDTEPFLISCATPALDCTYDVIDGKTVDWQALKRANPDVIGWLQVKGTAINTPIVQAPENDPEFYLTHNLYKEPSMYGCAYLDAGCLADFSSPHNVIYGHNMGWDNAVFADFQLFSDADFAAEHNEAVIATPHGVIPLHIQTARVIDGSRALCRVEFASKEDFAAYCENVLGVSAHEANHRPDGSTHDAQPAQLFTFCTCSYSLNPDNERTLVFACPAS